MSQLPPSTAKINRFVSMHKPFVPTPGILHQSFPLPNRHSTPASHDLASENFPFQFSSLVSVFIYGFVPSNWPSIQVNGEREKVAEKPFSPETKKHCASLRRPKFSFKEFPRARKHFSDLKESGVRKNFLVHCKKCFTLPGAAAESEATHFSGS